MNRMHKQMENWESIKEQVYKTTYGFSEFFDYSYAILYDRDGKVEIERLPSASDWGRTGWIKIGEIEGLGLDGIRIILSDPETDRIILKEEGYFNLPEE